MCNSTPLEWCHLQVNHLPVQELNYRRRLTLRREELGKSWSWRSKFTTLRNDHAAIDGPSQWSTKCLKTTLQQKCFFFPSPSTHTCTRPPLCFCKSMPLPDWTLPYTILQDSDFPSSSTKTFMNSNKSIFSSYYMNPFDPWCLWQKIWYLMTYHLGVFSNYFLWLSHLAQWISLKIFASMAHILTARLLPSSQHNSGTNWYLKNCWWLVLYGSLKKKIEVFE